MSTDIQIGGTVNQPLRDLELRREELFRQIENLGDFRRGIISVNYRKCGKSNCACARKGHPGHGPQYLWNVSVGGKTQARNLPLGPELEKRSEEHTSELQSRGHLVCRLLLEKKNKNKHTRHILTNIATTHQYN